MAHHRADGQSVDDTVPAFDVHFEQFLHLAGLGHDKALICWGGFYFRRGDSPYGEWRIVDDEELATVAPTPRTETIGAGSEPFGHATVEVERDGRVVARAATEEHNHLWVTGLEPDTEYRYRVLVDGPAVGRGRAPRLERRAAHARAGRWPIRQPLPHVPANRSNGARHVRRARRLRRRHRRRATGRRPSAPARPGARARGRPPRRAARASRPATTSISVTRTPRAPATRTTSGTPASTSPTGTS